MVRYLKRLKSSRLGRVQAFPMYVSLGMSMPSLHRESTDSLILGFHNTETTSCYPFLKKYTTCSILLAESMGEICKVHNIQAIEYT